MSTFGIVILLCLVLAFIELHRWNKGKVPWVYGYPHIKKTVLLLFLRFLKHLSVIRCYPGPVFQWRRKDGKIIWREANPKASRCLDPDTKLKNTRGIIILRRNIFLMLGHIFSFLRAAAFLPHPGPKSLEPRPKFACRSKILQNQIFIFVADPYYNRSGAALTPPVRPNKKGAVSWPLLICKLFVNFFAHR